jgi:Ca-activated chloride channel family protein
MLRRLVGLALVVAAALLGPPHPAEAAGLLVAEGGFGGTLEIKEQRVRVVINNGVAVTEVDQTFLNRENRVVEALYTFPVPRGASVSDFTMWIGGKPMVGEVVEKKRAREIYESYRQVRRDPGLLEQVDFRRFEMRIFPIAAGAEQRVRLVYHQELEFDNDVATYVYPLATTTRGGASETAGRFTFNLDARSEVPIVELTTSSHQDRLATARHNAHYRQASLEATAADLSRDVVVAYRLERPRTGLDLVASRTGSEDGYLLLTLTAGKELEQASTGMDYVFVLDVSGSMANDGKLRLGVDSLAAFVDTLGAEDRFELMAFNIAPVERFRSLVAAGSDTKASAREFLGSQQARGGTVLRPALEAAYRYRDPDRTLNVVVLSDGLTEQAEHRELLSLIAQRPSGTRVFCLGVGNDVNQPLLRQLAEESGGLAAFISHGDDFRRQAQAFRRKLERPAATDVKIAIEGGDVYDVEPATLPNLYHGAPVRLYARYRKPGRAVLRVEADLMGQPLRQSFPIELPEREDANPQIERMWAFRRVQRLLDDGRRAGTVDQDEVVRLCEAYSIASEYASFIVLENDAEYQRWKIERRNAARVERDERALEAVRRKLEALRRKAEQQAGPVDPDARPDSKAPAGPAASQAPSITPATSGQPAPAQGRRGFDLPLPRRGGGGGGGGAIDPVSAVLLLGAGAAGLRALRRRQ